MLVGMQKINFITHFFLEILQTNSKLVILGNLGMPGDTPKIMVSVWGNIWHLSAGKKHFILGIFLCQFLNVSIIYHHVKNQKKLMTHPDENAELIDRETTMIL